MANDFLGLLGLALIVVAWTPGLGKVLKAKRTGMTRPFMLLYFLGSASLAAYAWQLQAYPFLILNALAAMVPVAHFYYDVRENGF